MKRIIALIIVFVMMVSTLCACNAPKSKSLSLQDQIRIAANNMQNGSSFATDGEYLYCSAWDDGLSSLPYLMKVRFDDFSVESTSEKMMASGYEFSPHNVICIDDTLYYYDSLFYNLYSIDTDFTESIYLPLAQSDTIFQTDGTYYYVSDWALFSDFGVYRANIEDIEPPSVNPDKDFTKISDIYTSKLILQGDYLYVFSGNITVDGVENKNMGLWRMDLDGENPIQILDYLPSFLLVSEDRIYSAEDDGRVYSMDLDGSDRFILSEVNSGADRSVYSINIAHDYIFYQSSYDGLLHRASIDGILDSPLTDCPCTEITVVGDWIIYRNENDWNYYKIRIDGTGHSLISESPSKPSEATEIAATPEITETPVETEPEVFTQGWYTLEEAQEMTGMFILYPDGSFDRYYSGSVLTWETHPMTYGADSFPENLIISTSRIERNVSIKNEGQLVLFWPYENRVRKGLYTVEESGYSLFRTDDEGDLEGLILTRGSTTGTSLKQWNQGHEFYWSNSIDYTTINGVLKEEYDSFPSTEGRDFGSFPANETFTIGVIEGTTLVEKEYTTDHMYFLHADESSPYTLTPTTDGYAILDFSDTDPGEYVFTVSRWDEDARSRKVYSTYILVE